MSQPVLPPGPPSAGPPPAGPPAGWRPPTPVVETKQGPGLLVRAVWFVFVGWWLTGITSTVAWFAMVTIIGLPLGIWLINRIPTFLTLRPRSGEVYAWTDQYGSTRYAAAPIQQPPWWIRGLWFIVVGWWASALVMSIGFLLVVLIITLPLGLMIYNRVPLVASLYRY